MIMTSQNGGRVVEQYSEIETGVVAFTDDIKFHDKFPATNITNPIIYKFDQLKVCWFIPMISHTHKKEDLVQRNQNQERNIVGEPQLQLKPRSFHLW